MKICEYCGSQIDEKAKFCEHCGAGQELQHEVSQPMHTEEVSGVSPNVAQDTSKQEQPKKSMAVLAYLSWLIFIPLLMAREDDFVRFHLNQALSLLLVKMLLMVISSRLDGMVNTLPMLAARLGGLVAVVNLIRFIFVVMGLIYALQGRKKELPLIGRIRMLK